MEQEQNILEGEAEELEAEEPSQERQPEPQPSEPQQETRSQREELLREEARVLRDQMDRYRQEAEYLRQSYVNPNTQAYEDQRMAEMDPDQRVMYSVDKFGQTMRSQMLQQSVQMNSRLDQMEFKNVLERLSADMPTAKRHESEVERIYNQCLSNALQVGRADLAPNRMQIFDMLLGKERREKGVKLLKGARKEAAENMAKQQTRSGNMAGNVGGSRSGETPYQAAMRRMRERVPDGGY